jgi:hypothetical protein
MTISLLPALIAVLLGLLASGAVDFVTDSGNTHADAWTAFALALLLVARDTLFGGALWPRRRDDARKIVDDLASKFELHGSDLRLGVHVWSFEPVATTLAILLGLLTSQAIDFTNANGDPSAWAWAVFALSLFLTIGGRLNRRPNRQRDERRAEHRRAWKRAAGGFEARFGQFFENLERPGRESHPDDNDDG